MVENLWHLGPILEVKSNKGVELVRRVRIKTKSVILEHPIKKNILLEAPELHKSSLTLLILISSIAYQQSLFYSENCRQKCDCKCDMRVAPSKAVSCEQCGRLTHLQPTTCVAYFCILPHRFSSKRESQLEVCLLYL